jgi:hypothetical protein
VRSSASSISSRPAPVPSSSASSSAAGQIRIEARVLDEPGHARGQDRFGARERLAEQLDRAFVGAQQPEHQPQQRGLAGAVWPQQPPNLALVDLQVDPVERDRLVEALDQAARANGAHGRALYVRGG